MLVCTPDLSGLVTGRNVQHLRRNAAPGALCFPRMGFVMGNEADMAALIAGVCSELKKMAEKKNLSTLVHILSMAVLEAARTAQKPNLH